MVSKLFLFYSSIRLLVKRWSVVSLFPCSSFKATFLAGVEHSTLESSGFPPNTDSGQPASNSCTHLGSNAQARHGLVQSENPGWTVVPLWSRGRFYFLFPVHRASGQHPDHHPETPPPPPVTCAMNVRFCRNPSIFFYSIRHMSLF